MCAAAVRPPPALGAGRPADFWSSPARGAATGAKASRKAFADLVGRVRSSSGIVLFDAVEAGVPTHLVDVIAEATGQSVSSVMDIIGVSPTTFRRKDEAGEVLP